MSGQSRTTCGARYTLVVRNNSTVRTLVRSPENVIVGIQPHDALVTMDSRRSSAALQAGKGSISVGRAWQGMPLPKLYLIRCFRWYTPVAYITVVNRQYFF